MKKKISDLFCLMKCGLSFKSQVAFGILFLILGSVWEVFPILGEVNMIDMGSVFLFCAVMFPTPDTDADFAGYIRNGTDITV